MSSFFKIGVFGRVGSGLKGKSFLSFLVKISLSYFCLIRIGSGLKVKSFVTFLVKISFSYFCFIRIGSGYHLISLP
jgi:hypothetical protein